MELFYHAIRISDCLARPQNRIDMAMYPTYHASSRFLLKNSPRTAMSATLEIESILNDRYQTTIPEPVRRALRLEKRDKIHYAILPDGSVRMRRVTENDDPVLGRFLDFLAEDMAAHPARLQALDDGLQARIIALLGPMAYGESAVRQPGSMKGQIRIADDFDAPLPDELLGDFAGN